MSETIKGVKSIKKRKVKNDGLREMQQCFGPSCAYRADIGTSPTGFSWKELQLHRENNIRRVLALRGIFEPSLEMLFDRPVPSHIQFNNITNKEVKR